MILDLNALISKGWKTTNRCPNPTSTEIFEIKHRNNYQNRAAASCGCGQDIREQGGGRGFSRHGLTWLTVTVTGVIAVRRRHRVCTVREYRKETCRVVCHRLFVLSTPAPVCNSAFLVNQLFYLICDECDSIVITLYNVCLDNNTCIFCDVTVGLISGKQDSIVQNVVNWIDCDQWEYSTAARWTELTIWV